jgi:hypothetical protein
VDDHRGRVEFKFLQVVNDPRSAQLKKVFIPSTTSPAQFFPNPNPSTNPPIVVHLDRHLLKKVRLAEGAPFTCCTVFEPAG